MRIVRLFAVATLLCAVALVLLIDSQHRARLIVGSYEQIDSNGFLPPSRTLTYMIASESPNAPGFDSIISFLESFETSHPELIGDAMPALDNPDTCERLVSEGKPVHCYNADIGVCSILAKQGVLARMWDITGPEELGGDGHNLLEIFDRSSNSWKALDPYYHCYFTLRSDSLRPIDVPTMRMELLKHSSNVKLVRYATTVETRPDTIVLNEIHYLVPCSMLHANNNFRTRYDNRYGLLMPFAPLFDKLPLRISRGVRMIMLGDNDRRYIIEDSHSPHYAFLKIRLLFWTLFISTGTFFILSLISLVDARKKVVRSAR